MSCEATKRENCLRQLMTRFNTLGSGIIRYIAEKHNFDAHKANMTLMELTGAVVNKPQYKRSPRIDNPDSYVSIEEIEECIDEVLTGARLLIILRGIPGSGKSFLAKSILKACYPDPEYKLHIHSADNYFMQNGRYVFDARRIDNAHKWNQANVNYRMLEGFSPIIVDNTNTQIWEMQSYLGMAVHHGYKVRLLEVNTRWCFNCYELTKRNQHCVPKKTIKAMLERYEMGITAEQLLEIYHCPLDFQKAPLLRRSPRFIPVSDSIEDHPAEKPAGLPRSKKKSIDENAVGSIASTPPKRSPEKQRKNGIYEEEVNKSSAASNTSNAISPIQFSWDAESGDIFKYWKNIDPPKCINNEPTSSEKKPSTSESGTNTSLIDFQEDSKDLKVIYGRCREITDYHQQMAVQKRGMLDKSCSTHEDVVPDRNEDLKKLYDIFQKIPPVYIREMYDDCQGNFDMTFEIFIEDNKDYSHLPYTLDNVISNTNEVQEAKRECELTKQASEESLNEASALPQETPKKSSSPVSKSSNGPSTSTGAIKKYSKVTPSIKNECISPETVSEDENTCGSPVSEIDSDFDSQSSASPSDSDSVELNLGQFLVNQLEKEFRDPSHDLPDGFQPVVQVPKSLARQLYAFYVESVYQQMEVQQSILANLVKEDEAFARKLYEEENGVKRNARPESLREIMNEQAALKIYQKEISELKTPNDLATQLTKKKLFESFPSVEQSAIMELYHANSLDYQRTVDDLMTSVGASRGSNANLREPPISQSTLQELERAQKDSKQAQEEDQKTPDEYRREAEYYLRKRNELYQKAQEHYNRGQKEVAQFYSQLAQQQTQYYDVANNKAASVFLEENSKQLQNMNTLDLHFLFVKEAISALDVFIDSNIESLNANKGKATRDLLIITGRGKRSVNGVSRIRPAVIRRLEARNISDGRPKAPFKDELVRLVMRLVAWNSLIMFDIVFVFFLFLVAVTCLVYYLPGRRIMESDDNRPLQCYVTVTSVGDIQRSPIDHV